MTKALAKSSPNLTAFALFAVCLGETSPNHAPSSQLLPTCPLLLYRLGYARICYKGYYLQLC